MRARFIGILAAILVLAGSTAPARAEWYRADTHNFVIYSNGSARQLEDFATNVERFDALLRVFFDVEREEQPNRLTIFMLSRASDVAEVYGDRNSSVAGFYVPSSEGSFAVSNRERRETSADLTGQITLFHEYAHHLMARYFNYAYPSWYREGFAEYFSTATFDKEGKWTLGRPAQHRAYGLFLVRTPVKKLLFGDASGLSAEASDGYYGRAWLMVHMFASDKERLKQLKTYLIQLNEGKEPQEAAVALGDLNRLDRDLDTYRNGRISYSKSSTPMAYDGTISIVELDKIASRLAELSMRRRAGKDARKTRDELAKLAALAPERAPVLLELALAERDLAETVDKPNYTAAEAAADAVLAIDPKNVRANVLKARLMMHRLEDGNATEADWRKARSYIATANRADPEDPQPLLAFAESYRHEKSDPPPIVVDAMAKAFSLVPEATDVRINYALALAQSGSYDPALKLVRFLAADPHASAEGKAAVKRIEGMRDGVFYYEEPDFSGMKGGKNRGDEGDD